ncbi:MAG: hypothetical protein IKP72_11220 [Clostridia bacterium]|nr:hypothetical protein [Clostridia bacterium]
MKAHIFVFAFSHGVKAAGFFLRFFAGSEAKNDQKTNAIRQKIFSGY